MVIQDAWMIDDDLDGEHRLTMGTIADLEDTTDPKMMSKCS